MEIQKLYAPPYPSLNKLMTGISFLPMIQDASKLLASHFLFFPSRIMFIMFFQNNHLQWKYETSELDTKNTLY